jgi:hypothetical protein
MHRRNPGHGDRSPKTSPACHVHFVSNLLGVDASGLAVTPLTTYADTRIRRNAEALRHRLDEAATTSAPARAYTPAI